MGATRTTLMSSRKVSLSDPMTPRRKPWESPRVEPGFMAARMRGVQLRLRGVGDEEHDEVGLGDDVERLAEGAVLLGEAARAGLVVGLGGRAEADADLGVHADLGEGVLEVLRLRGRLGAPADDADGVDALERLGELLEEVAATADDVLTLAGDIDELLLEKLGVDVELGGGGRGDDRRGAAGSGFVGFGGLAGREVLGHDGRRDERAGGRHGRHCAESVRADGDVCRGVVRAIVAPPRGRMRRVYRRGFALFSALQPQNGLCEPSIEGEKAADLAEKGTTLSRKKAPYRI